MNDMKDIIQETDQTDGTPRQIISVHWLHSMNRVTSLSRHEAQELKQTPLVMYNGNELRLQEQLILQDALSEKYGTQVLVQVKTRRPLAVEDLERKPAWSNARKIPSNDFSPAIRTSIHDITEIERKFYDMSTMMETHLAETKQQQKKMHTRMDGLATELHTQRTKQSTDMKKLMQMQKEQFSTMMLTMQKMGSDEEDEEDKMT
jgi:pyoverdine/dityrosine biosynthesis protein Dit1